MQAYNYHPDTKIYIGEETCIPSPLEPGKFLLPAYATFRTPPQIPDGKYAKFDGDDWGLHIPLPPEPEPEPEPVPITWDDIRTKRNGLLWQSDWTQLPDVALTEEQVTAWRAYRVELRNITSAFDSPESVVWPTAP